MTVVFHGENVKEVVSCQLSNEKDQLLRALYITVKLVWFKG